MAHTTTNADEDDALPEGWVSVALRDVTVESTARNRDLLLGRGDVLGVDNQEGLLPSDRVLGEDFSRYKLVQRDQFAYNPMRLNVGSIGLCKSDVVRLVSPDYIVFECLPGLLDPEFMDLFRRSSGWDEQIQRSGQGSVRIRYYYRHIAEFSVPLPPLTEQKAIAYVLRTTQAAIRETEQVVTAAADLKQSLMRHLFTYGPVPFGDMGRVTLKDTEFGPIPSHWEVGRLGDHAKIGNGSTPKRTNPNYWQEGAIPWLTSGKVHDRIIQESREFVTELAAEECHLPLVKKGSVVVAITGQGKTLGTAALLALDTCVSQHLAYIQPRDERIVPEFLLAFLQQRYRHFREVSSGGGSTKGALTCGFLKGYPCPLPPKVEQSEIARIVEAAERKLDASRSRAQSLDALFRSLLHHLMTGKLRVGPFAPTSHEEVAP